MPYTPSYRRYKNIVLLRLIILNLGENGRIILKAIESVNIIVDKTLDNEI